jgi:DNA replication protein DnaC
MKAAEEILLHDHLKRLRMPTIRKVYGECARQAEESGARYETYLLQLTSQETEQREHNQIQSRLKEAHFPQLKTLEATDFSKWPDIDAREIRSYAEGDWLKKKENLVFIGKHGTGKTHAAIAFGVEACRLGYRVRFTTASELVNTLTEARDERRLSNQLKRFRSYGLLIIDELGYLPMTREGAQLFFQVLADRYEKASTLLTSNLTFGQWNQVFEDANLTAALLDRLTHHCHVHQFTWESIRFHESMKKRAAR